MEDILFGFVDLVGEGEASGVAAGDFGFELEGGEAEEDHVGDGMSGLVDADIGEGVLEVAVADGVDASGEGQFFQVGADFGFDVMGVEVVADVEVGVVVHEGDEQEFGEVGFQDIDDAGKHGPDALDREDAVAIDQDMNAGVDRQVAIELALGFGDDAIEFLDDQLLEVAFLQAAIDQMNIAKASYLFGAEFSAQGVFDIDDRDFLGEGVENIGVNVRFGDLVGHVKGFVEVATDQNQGFRVIDGFIDLFFPFGLLNQLQHLQLGQVRHVFDFHVDLQHGFEILGFVEIEHRIVVETFFAPRPSPLQVFLLK